MSTTKITGGGGEDQHQDAGGGGGHEGAVAALLGHLDTWDKLLVVAGAVAALGLAVFLLVCCVGEGCLLHDLITRRKSEPTPQYSSSRSGIYKGFVCQERSSRIGRCLGHCMGARTRRG